MNNIFKRTVALLLAAVMCFTSYGFVFAVDENGGDIDEYAVDQALLSKYDLSLRGNRLQNEEDYETLLDKNGYRTLTTDEFLKRIKPIVMFNSFLRGDFLREESDRRFEVTFDQMLSDYCAQVCEQGGLDIEKLLTSLPQNGRLIDLTTSLFKIDTAEFRRQMIQKANDIYAEQPVLSSVYLFIGIFFSCMKGCNIYAEAYDKMPNVYQVVLQVLFNDGGFQELRPGIFIDIETGECFNEIGVGLVSTGFNFSLEQMMVYAPINAWMRNFGFCLFYDINCYVMPMWNYITRRFKFNYGDEQWMIQIWKGNYLITNGGEVGIYNRPKGSIGSFYNCAGEDDEMVMTLKITQGDKTVIDLGPERHWWINGFQMDRKMYWPNTLDMTFSIEMKDEEMVKAFCKAIDRERHHDVTYVVNGLTVSCLWARK